MCNCVCVRNQEQGTLPWNLMMSLSFPKTVSQCQRWEKIISLHTVNESQRLSQPSLREGYYSAHRLWASLINFSHHFLFFLLATCGYFQRVVILFFSFSNFTEKNFCTSYQAELAIHRHVNIYTLRPSPHIYRYFTQVCI